MKTKPLAQPIRAPYRVFLGSCDFDTLRADCIIKTTLRNVGLSLFMGVSHMLSLFAQTATPAAQTFDWGQIAVIYGPFIAGIGILLKMHRDFVYVYLPKALRAMRRELRATREVNQAALDTLLDLECCKDCSGSENRIRIKQSARSRSRKDRQPLRKRKPT